MADISYLEPPTPKEVDPYTDELARRLAAAAVSVNMGLSLQHTYKRYFQTLPRPMGEYWLSLAEQIIEHGDSRPVAWKRSEPQ